MQYTGTQPEIAQKLQAFLAEKKGGRGAALSAAVVLNGEMIAAAADGVRGADDSPAALDDLYNVGSISKIYCTAAVMKLVELGGVDLDTPVVEYIPRFRMKDKRFRSITLRMTLNHSSGMPGTNYHNAIADFWSGDHIMEENYAYWEHAALKADPGQCSVYCNDGFELAAAVIEAVSGKRYIDFLREFVLLPAGLDSTGEAEAAIGDRRMMSCRGQSPEWLTALGAGAVRTTVSDCARFGYLFIDPQDCLSGESVRETARAQGVTFLEHDHTTPGFGLGWDSVRFSAPNLSLGGGVLAKGGATAQFLSYLIVSPEYRLSAAISGTMDCCTDNPRLLCELIGMVMESLGIELPHQEVIPVCSTPLPVPEEWEARFSGIYYSSVGVFKVETAGEELVISRYAGGGQWDSPPILPPMRWNGERFYSGINSAVFEQHGASCYLITRIRPDRDEFVVLAQKDAVYQPLSRGWKDRVGRKYIICNLHAHDLAGLKTPAVYVDTLFDDGVILFVLPANPFMPALPFKLGDYHALPAVSSGDDETAMFLNCPGDGSRDIYAPEVFSENGREYLRLSGFLYISSESVQDLESGIVTSDRGAWNAVRRIQKGYRAVFDTPDFNIPDEVVIHMLNDDLTLVYSSAFGQPMPPFCDGYIICSSNSPMNFRLEVRSI